MRTDTIGTIVLLWLALVLITPPVQASEPVLEALGIQPDSPAKSPVKTLRTLDGQRQNLTDSSAYTVLNIWASWCIPCRDEMSVLQELNQRTSRDQLRVLTINLGEDSGTIRSFLSNHNLTLPVVPDNDQSLYKTFFVRDFPTLPATVVLERNGIIIGKKLGQLDPSVEALVEHLEYRSSSR
ncbi:MAG: TlpA family protein disulfide reductase [bacterium]